MDSENKSVGERIVERLTEFRSLAEAVATIETLRRRVAELEEKIEHYDTAEYHLSQMVKSLTAENAELKDRVFMLETDMLETRGYISCDQCGRLWSDDVDFSACDCGKSIDEMPAVIGPTKLRAENAELKDELSAVNDLIDTYDSVELEYEKQHRIWNCLCDGVYFAIGATKEDAFHNAARATANCGEQPLSEIQAVHDAILRGDD